jgi:phosphatidylglycerol:prolipoprotein diacylglycerol transferase
MAAGIVGARLAYVASDPADYLTNPLKILRVDEGGLVFYGGFVGAAAAVILFARRRRADILALGDLAVTALPLGHAMGRIGCFLNGCCYGRQAADGWGWAVTYPRDSLAWYRHCQDGLISGLTSSRSLPVLPVQLYEAGFNLALFLVLVRAFRLRLPPGRVAALYFLMYPPVRFALERLRGDARIRLAGMTLAQLTSLGLFAAGLVIMLLSMRRGRATAGDAGA